MFIMIEGEVVEIQEGQKEVVYWNEDNMLEVVEINPTTKIFNTQEDCSKYYIKAKKKLEQLKANDCIRYDRNFTTEDISKASPNLLLHKFGELHKENERLKRKKIKHLEKSWFCKLFGI